VEPGTLLSAAELAVVIRHLLENMVVNGINLVDNWNVYAWLCYLAD